MARLGTFTKTQDGFAGRIRSIELDIPVLLVAAEKAEGRNGPDYRALTEEGAEIGAGWKRTGRKSGKSYIGLVIDDPSLSAPVTGNLVEEDDGTWTLIWQRRSA